ncbi:23S ribosomal RNA methyltransferase Erm [Gordonia sp. i37]|nr:23S ribosomal RNA methyltransferase Erm [Gordonia sp. i37]
MPISSSHGGRHELGQNFLVHQPTIQRIVGLVDITHGPILEIGSGGGALTAHLAALDRPLTAIDIDARRIQSLQQRFPHIRAQHADVLSHVIDAPVVVGNIPFHLTTAILRRLLGNNTWTDAVLLVQWEVARRRAGIGGATMMTAQAAPWFDFALHGRVPARAFRPAPTVDGGILTIARRRRPLIDPHDRRRYERFVGDVFTGRGRGLAAILRRRGGGREVAGELRAALIPPNALPRDLDVAQWVSLWNSVGRR